MPLMVARVRRDAHSAALPTYTVSRVDLRVAGAGHLHLYCARGRRLHDMFFFISSPITAFRGGTIPGNLFIVIQVHSLS